MRFGIALALLLCILAALYLPRAFAQLAHQLGGDDVTPAGDLKAFHSTPVTPGGPDNHA